MASTPKFVGTCKSPSVAFSTANTNRDGTTGTYATLITAGADGSRVDSIMISALSTTTAGMIRVFLGTALIAEIPVLAITPSATQPVWQFALNFPNGLILAAAAVLKVSTHNAESFVAAITNGGDF